MSELMRSIVINKKYGGFGLSCEGFKLYREMGGNEELLFHHQLTRDDPILVRVVETLGEKANTEYAYLKVVKIPLDVKWYISDYDGIEEIHECHRSWE